MPVLLDPDPAVRLAGGRARRHLLVAHLLEAADRCHHAPRAPESAGARRRAPSSFVLGVVVVLADRASIAVGLGGAHRLTGRRPRPVRRRRPTLVAGSSPRPITIVVSYYLAIVTYRFGLDPDNQTRADHHQRHGPGRRRLRPPRYVSIGSAAAWMTTTQDRQRAPRRAEGRLRAHGRPRVRGRLLQRGEAGPTRSAGSRSG